MCLRSGKSLHKMMLPSMDNSISQNNPQNVVEQSVESMIEEAVVLTLVRKIAHVVSSTPVAPIQSHGEIPSPQPWSSPFNPMFARPVFRFLMPMNNREYPYVMPTSMMVDIHTNMLTYSDNAMAIELSYNPYNTSSSTINNMVRPGEICYISQVTPSLNTTSMIAMRQ